MNLLFFFGYAKLYEGGFDTMDKKRKENRYRILFLDQHFATPEGMMIPRVYGFARHLSRKNALITVISGVNRRSGLPKDGNRGGIRNFQIDKIKVICIGIPYNHFMSFFKRLFSFAGFVIISSLKVLFLKKPDVTVAVSTPLTIGIPAIILKKLRGVPFVFEVGDLWPEFAIGIGALKNPVLIKFAYFLERMCYRNATKIFTISEGCKQHLVERGVPGEKVFTIPFGVDFENTESIQADRTFRETHGLTDKFVAVYIGAHGPANGLEIVIEAGKILKKHPGIVLVLIGEGKEKKRLMEQAAEHGLDNILFCDSMPRKKLLAILKDVDAGLMITRNLIASMPKCPNLPRKFFDYLACGLPVLVNVDGDLSKIVEEKQVGLVCGEKAPGKLADNILKLFSTKDLRESMSRNSSKLACDYDLADLNRVFEKEVLGVFADKDNSGDEN